MAMGCLVLCMFAKVVCAVLRIDKDSSPFR